MAAIPRCLGASLLVAIFFYVKAPLVPIVAIAAFAGAMLRSARRA